MIDEVFKSCVIQDATKDDVETIVKFRLHLQHHMEQYNDNLWKLSEKKNGPPRFSI
jgi:hypothetical protein